jgi:hypothetical protein
MNNGINGSNSGSNSRITHELIPEKIRGMALGITHDMIIGTNRGRNSGSNNSGTNNERNNGRTHGTNINSEDDSYSNTGMNHEITKQMGGKLKIIIEKLPGLLEEYKKYFIFFHKNPEVAEYQQIYVQYKSQLQTTNKELTDLGENVEQTILQTNKNISGESSTLTDKKQHFKQLILGFEHYQGSLSGADQMIEDFKTLYNIQYYKNVQIIYGIGIIGFIITFLMKKK